MKGAIIFLVSVLLLQTAPASPVTPAAGKEAEEEDVDDEYYDYDDTTDESAALSDDDDDDDDYEEDEEDEEKTLSKELGDTAAVLDDDDYYADEEEGTESEKKMMEDDYDYYADEGGENAATKEKAPDEVESEDEEHPGGHDDADGEKTASGDAGDAPGVDADVGQDDDDDDYYDYEEEDHDGGGGGGGGGDVPSLDSVLESARTRSSTRAKFLPGLTPKLLAGLGEEELLSHARDVRVVASLNRTRLDVFAALLRRLPANVSAEIASMPGMLVSLREDQIMLVSDRLDILELTDHQKILELANKRTEVVLDLPWQAVNLFIRIPGFVKSLSRRTIGILVKSKRFASTLEKIPKSSIAQVVTENPDTLVSLPRDYPARPYVQKLTEDEQFLRMIPMNIHVYLAETPFRHRLSRSTVRKILQIYPDLPAVLSRRGLEYNSKYTTDPSFLNSLPCYVVFTLGSRPSFVDRLSREELSALAGSVHVWSCLPVELVRVMMRDTTVGRRLSIADVYRASKAMTAAKSLDSKVVYTMFRYQFPSLLRGTFKRIFGYGK